MSAQLTEEQQMIRESVESYLRDRYGDEERRRIIASDEGWSREHWKAFAQDLGLLGAGIAEEFGGLGGGVEEHGVIMEAFGGALVVEPYVPTAVIGGGFLAEGHAAQSSELLEGIVSGEVTFAYAHGESETRYNLAHVATTARRDGDDYVIDGNKSVVLGGPWASHFIVIARTSGAPRDKSGISAFVVPADSAGIEARDFTTISGGRASELTLTGVRVPAANLLAPEGEALPLIEKIVDLATAVICVEAVGVMKRIHADTLAYTQERKQFGRALADFQALQHRMADMLISITKSDSMAGHALRSLNEPADERAAMVSAAKVFIGKACRFVGQNGIQLHGGMGMTEELAVGYYFRRAMEIERQFGNVDHHLTRYERLKLAPEPA